MDSSGPLTRQLDERVFRTALNGGPVVLSEEMPGLRSVAVGIWVAWGASHDPVEQMGAAHMLEHMIFKGTEGRTPREIALEIEGIGGSLDAYTSREHTACYAKVLNDDLPIAVDVLTDLVFRPLLRESDLELERQVILEEIAGVEDTPEDLVFDVHARCVWGRHPYGNPVLGTAETVEAITHRDLLKLWERAFRPEACVVAAAGQVRHEELLELVRRYFPTGEGAVAPGQVPDPEPAPPEEYGFERDSSQVHICLGARIFPRQDPRRYAAIMAHTALGGGMSSRLFQRVREELGLAYTVYSFQSFYARAGLSGIYMATRPEMVGQALEEVRAELEALASAGLTAEELDGIKDQTKGQLILSLESTSARLQRLVGVALYEEPYLTLDELCAKVDAVKQEEVAELCREYYAPEQQVVARLGPSQGNAASGGTWNPFRKLEPLTRSETEDDRRGAERDQSG